MNKVLSINAEDLTVTVQNHAHQRADRREQRPKVQADRDDHREPRKVRCTRVHRANSNDRASTIQVDGFM